MTEITTVWVFNGSGRRFPNFPSAVFTSLDRAEQWITKNGASGILTEYPLDVGAYDWAVSNGFFQPSKDEHRTPAFITAFSDASQEHHHYEDGQRVSG